MSGAPASDAAEQTPVSSDVGAKRSVTDGVDGGSAPKRMRSEDSSIDGKVVDGPKHHTLSENEIEQHKSDGPAAARPVASGSVEVSGPSEPRSFSIRVAYSAAVTSDKPVAVGESPPMLKTFCNHDVSLPAGFKGTYKFEDGDGVVDTPAKTYSFTLDAFQKESIRCIERGENVLVAAHTSAGKTVVAEYAIAKCLKNKQRVIYTSPIKALSNQKYREFSEEHKDVGLMTGDVTINKNASCLIMTTEIYRSMLYRGSEIVREVAWVIFDEVHAMRSKDRGTVWEESFILSPENVHFVFLSATIPNAREFSEWIAKLKAKPCHTIYTDTRPVPLQHYVFAKGGTGLHLVVDDNGQFRENSFELAMNELGGGPDDRGDASGGTGRRDRRRSRGGGPGGAPGDKSDSYKLIKMIMERNFYPVIVFCFARRECESLAVQMSKLDFNTDAEKELVREIFRNALASLVEEDRDLPQVSAALPLLERGIGIHHSGLLPIVKEAVELLFQEGLLKALFATETFSMGLNMPAKTVVFKEMRKFDGETTRFVSSGEYVQMSGRAGRRGLDASGLAILMCDERVEPKVVRDITCGTAEPLNSSFRLGYNMLLNLLRAEEANPEYVIARSFAQFQGDRLLPQYEKEVKEIKAKMDAIVIGVPDTAIDEKSVRDYFRLRVVADSLRTEIREFMQRSQYSVPFLQPGRLVRVKETRGAKHDFGWGVVIQMMRKAPGIVPQEERYTAHILVRCVTGSNEGKRARPYVESKAEKAAKKTNLPGASNGDGDRQGSKQKPTESDGGEWMIVTFGLKDIENITVLRVFKPDDLRSFENRASVGASIGEALRRFSGAPPNLDPVADMEITEEAFAVLLSKAEVLDETMRTSPLTTTKNLKGVLVTWKEKLALEKTMKAVMLKVKMGKGMLFQDELKRMKRVLRRLGFVSAEGVVEVKGRLACEVNTADELVLTELMLGGLMNDMTPEVLVAVCSCFVVDEAKKDGDNLDLEKELEKGLDALKAVCTRVGTVTKESKIPIDIDEYVESFSPVGMRVIYHWCRGSDFAAVCKLTPMFEGTIIRCMRRLEELLRQLVAAAKSIGNTELEQKIEAGSEKLRRGIAFQASLYM